MHTVEHLANLILPLIVLFHLLWGLIKGIPLHTVFIRGAKKGLKATVKITPYLIAMLVSIRVFRAAGGMDLLTSISAPLTGLFGVPQEVMPMFLIRPLSGTGALAMLGELLSTHGPDSIIGLLASTIMGSTETTFYIMTVYFGAINIRQLRHALAIGLWADLAGFIGAIIACSYFCK